MQILESYFAEKYYLVGGRIDNWRLTCNTRLGTVGTPLDGIEWDMMAVETSFSGILQHVQESSWKFKTPVEEAQNEVCGKSREHIW